MNDPSQFPALLAPFTLSGQRLRNRVVHASMSTRMQVNARVSDMLVQYHANRAHGGAAMIVTEPLAAAPFQVAGGRVTIWNDSDLDGLKRWAEAVESQDCRLLGQIQDNGRGRREPGRNPNAVGASVLPDDLSWTVPRMLSADEIRAMIETFAQSARRLQLCGFSGVELSAAHGHLFHQFLSPWANTRTDAFGGDWEGRCRFLNELVSAIRAECGSGFIVGLKIPADDGVRGSIGPAESQIFTDLLTRSGEPSYVCHAQGAHARSLEMHIPDRYGPRMPYLEMCRTLRAATNGVPTIMVGRITDPAEAEAILTRGDGDLIGLGRPLVADPAFLKKATSGRTHDIRYCLSCNTCWDTIITHNRAIACVNNPRVGRADEVDFWPTPASVRQRVAIVGTGIAGMEAAWVAAARGHNVTVFGRSTEVGGKARLRWHLPGGETVSSIYDYQEVAARRSGARLVMGKEATAADVLSVRPDVVVLATGAAMLPPRFLPDDVIAAGLVPDLRTALADLIGVTSRQPGAAVIFDMDHTEATYAAAEYLHGLFERVVLVTPREIFATDMPIVTRQGTMRRMHHKRIEMVTLAEPRWSDAVEDGRLEIVDVYNGDVTEIEDVALFTYATPRAPDFALAAPLAAAGVEIRRVGDCLFPSELLAATAAGHAAGEAI